VAVPPFGPGCTCVARERPIDFEGSYLSKLARTTRDVTVLKRARIILHSYPGFSPPKIARMVWWSEAWVRRVIWDWNLNGRNVLFPERSSGWEPTFTKPVRRALMGLALSRPKRGPRAANPAVVTRRAAGQRDPRGNRGDDLAGTAPADPARGGGLLQSGEDREGVQGHAVRPRSPRGSGSYSPPVVVAADRDGANLVAAVRGRTLSCMGEPASVCATYIRTHGVRYPFAIYDFYHDVMRGFLGQRKDART